MTDLFFVGNKRSGTSLMVRLLNRHPNVFVSHEAGTGWLMYNYGMSGKMKSGHTHDLDPHSIKATKKRAAHLIAISMDGPGDIDSEFERLQSYIHGWPDQEILVIGDKIPNRQIEMHDWTVRNFPRVRYVHCVRHPLDWVESAWGFRHKLNYGKSRSQMLASWVGYEQAALCLCKEVPSLRVRYEDLASDTESQMNHVWDWLCVGATRCDQEDGRGPRTYKRDTSLITSDVASLMKEYGYE